MTILERLEHFEKHQLDEGDEYGAEVLHNAARVIRELAQHTRDLEDALQEAFSEYPYENESGVKKMTLQSFAHIQRIRRGRDNLSPDTKELLE